MPDNPLGFPFSNACENHDLCYENCDKTQAQCDNEFKQEMLDQCSNIASKFKQKIWVRVLLVSIFTCLLFQVVGYMHLGYLDPFAAIAFVISFAYMFVTGWFFDKILAQTVSS